jgi:hypothetical protein
MSALNTPQSDLPSACRASHTCPAHPHQHSPITNHSVANSPPSGNQSCRAQLALQSYKQTRARRFASSSGSTCIAPCSFLPHWVNILRIQMTFRRHDRASIDVRSAGGTRTVPLHEGRVEPGHCRLELANVVIERDWEKNAHRWGRVPPS